MYHVRWMIRRDMAEVLEIEGHSFDYPWNEEDFVRCLRQRNCIGMVCEADEQVVGFMIYELHKDLLDVINIAVHKDWRHKGVFTTMVDKLKGKLTPQRRNRIVLVVRDKNLSAQLAFRSLGFWCTGIEKDFYEVENGCCEDGYRFVYRHYEPVSADSFRRDCITSGR